MLVHGVFSVISFIASCSVSYMTRAGSVSSGFVESCSVSYRTAGYCDVIVQFTYKHENADTRWSLTEDRWQNIYSSSHFSCWQVWAQGETSLDSGMSWMESSLDISTSGMILQLYIPHWEKSTSSLTSGKGTRNRDWCNTLDTLYQWDVHWYAHACVVQKMRGVLPPATSKMYQVSWKPFRMRTSHDTKSNTSAGGEEEAWF